MNTTTPTKPRPKTFDDPIVAAAAKALAPSVLEWLSDKIPLEEIEEDLRSAIVYASDGYEIARQLDGKYFPDAALVEILDSTTFHKHKALNEAERQWVNEVGLQAPDINASVIDRKERQRGIGVISKNYPEGKAVVRYESLGHVAPGQIGSQGYIICWEDLELITTV